MFYIKVHEMDRGIIVAMCDESLMGKVLSEGDLVINIKDYSDFYLGELSDGSEALNIKEIVSANVVGKEAVAAAIKNKIIDKEDVGTVAGVPYAQAFKL